MQGTDASRKDQSDFYVASIKSYDVQNGEWTRCKVDRWPADREITGLTNNAT